MVVIWHEAFLHESRGILFHGLVYFLFNITLGSLHGALAFLVGFIIVSSLIARQARFYGSEGPTLFNIVVHVLTNMTTFLAAIILVAINIGIVLLLDGHVRERPDPTPFKSNYSAVIQVIGYLVESFGLSIMALSLMRLLIGTIHFMYRVVADWISTE